MVAPVTAEPRLAPTDPSLPPEWKALVDGSTGYLYYWNTVTNVTTYQKPGAGYQEQEQKPVYPSSAASAYPSSAVTTNGHMNGSNGTVYGSQSQSNVAEQPMASLASSGHSYKRSAEAYENDEHAMYKRPKTLAASCSSYEAAEYRQQHEITVLGNDVPAPFLSFDSVGLPPEILRELQGAGFATPTPIQAQSWPIAMLGRDIVAIAKTGSGKTLGYLLPAFLHLQNRRNNPRMGPTVLVLAPTRELATQIHDEATKFGRSLRLTSACVYGGTPRGMQLRELERGPDIVIATPGRLNDFLEARKVTLRQVSYLVLDEADRMLDMGFEPQIRKIVMQAPAKRQTLMYTATWPKEVRRIAGDLLVSPAQVNIGNTDDLSANKAITQFVEMVHPYEKSRRLQQIIRTQEPGSKIIIFCSTKRMCDELARNLRADFGAAAIHGDKSQTERDWVLGQFKSGKSPVLVATDVAARGLDIKDIRVVINYDFPSGVEDYVHRIGRTGRAGATGLAYTFLSEQDGKYAKELIKVLEGANQKVPPELRDMASRGGYMKARGRWDSGGGRSGGYGGGGGSFRGGSSSAWNGGPPAANNSGWSGPPAAAGPVAPARYDDGWSNGRQQPQQSSYTRTSPTGSRSRSYDKYNEDRSRGRSGSPRHRFTGTAAAAGTGAAAAAAPTTVAGDNGYAPGDWQW